MSKPADGSRSNNAATEEATKRFLSALDELDETDSSEDIENEVELYDKLMQSRDRGEGAVDVVRRRHEHTAPKTSVLENTPSRPEDDMTRLPTDNDGKSVRVRKVPGSERKPELRRVSEQKPEVRRVSEQKPEVRRVSEQKPELRRVSEQKPELRRVSEQRPEPEVKAERGFTPSITVERHAPHEIPEAKPLAVRRFEPEPERDEESDGEMRGIKAKTLIKKIDPVAAAEGFGRTLCAIPAGFSHSVSTIKRGIGEFFRSAPDAYSTYFRGVPDRARDYFARHSIRRWAKERTPMQWVGTAFSVIGIIALVAVVSIVMYFDWALDQIHYVNPGEQYSAVSAGDYESVSASDGFEDDELSTSDMPVYEEPEVYISHSDLEGFKESMIDVDKKDVVNILLLGTDSRKKQYVKDNTDSMILCSINTKDKNIKLTSFMRDSYVKIPGHGSSRLNSAFPRGGIQLLFKTLKTNFDVDVDKYVRVNFSAFRQIVNTLGGVEIELDKAEVSYMTKWGKKYKCGPVEVGKNLLNGQEALTYARIRKIDSDFNRTQRQRKVLQAIAKKASESSLLTINKLVSQILPMVETNLTKEEIVSLMTPGLGAITKEIETLNVPIRNSWKTKVVGGAQMLSMNMKLNKKAIRAHIYSTWKLDLKDTVFKSYVYKDTGAGTTKKKTTTTMEETTKKSTTTEKITSKSTTKSTKTTTTTTTTKTSAETTKSTTKSTTKTTEKSTEAEETTTTKAPELSSEVEE